MPTKREATNTYTDAELLALHREALAEFAASDLCQEYRSGGKTFRRADLASIIKMHDWLESKVGTSEATTAGSGLVMAGVAFSRGS